MKKKLLSLRKLNTESLTESKLNDFRLDVYEGEILGLVGLNGSGKSTMTKILNGSLAFDSGLIEVDGHQFIGNHQRISRDQLETSGIYIITRETKLIGNLSIIDNLNMYHENSWQRWFGNPVRKENYVKRLMEAFVPNIQPEELGANLSDADICGISILKAYIKNAKVIVIDNVFEYCNDSETHHLMDLCHRMKEKGMSVILTYNRTDGFLSRCERIHVIRQGRNVGILFKDQFSAQVLAHMMMGTAFVQGGKPEALSKFQGLGKNTLMNIVDVSIEDGFEDLSFRLHEGEIFGIYDVGTRMDRRFLNMILGDEEIKKGSIITRHGIYVPTSIHEVLSHGIGVISLLDQEHLFYEDWKISENMLLSMGRQMNKKMGYIPRRLQRHLRNEFIKEESYLEDLPVAYMAGDEKFLLALNKFRMAGASVFIIDHPMQGADILTKNTIYKGIRELQRLGKGLIVISTQMSELSEYCNKILIFNQDGGHAIVEGMEIEKDTVLQTIL